MNRLKTYLSVALAGMAVLLFGSCEKTKSYSELLNEEEHAVNWFLADREIVPYVPEDSVFVTGENAPFYKMDEDGNVYMQVINRGDMTDRPEKGQTVIFRYMTRNIKDLYNGLPAPWIGNANDLSYVSDSFIYGNTAIPSTTVWGEGLQLPLGYVGYNSEVNLVIKSPMGMPEEMTSCLPYFYKIKYFKAEY